MKTCYETFSKKECDATENARIEMNLEQTRSNHNYTEMGFKKMKVPTETWKIIKEFYEQNKGGNEPIYCI
jgi:hypothetical protein